MPNQSTGGMTCSCAAKKDSLEIIMNIPVKIKAESVSAYKIAFEKCQAGSLQEDACLDYALFQSYTDSTEFHLFERWKNKPGHLAHMETSHFLQYREETKGMNERARTRMITTFVCPCVNE
jgi:quinol monooxygenase YgiN